MSITFTRSILAALLVSFTSSCATTYDAYGRPHQVVTPGGALLGAAVVGLIAYGIASSSHHHSQNNRPSNNGYAYRSNGYGSSGSRSNW